MISSVLLYDLKTNLRIFFDNSIDIKIINHDIFNKYAIYKFNQYISANTKITVFIIIFNLILRSLKQNILTNFTASLGIL